MDKWAVIHKDILIFNLSIPEWLEFWEKDPVEILLDLGFGAGKILDMYRSYEFLCLSYLAVWF